ncbi:MAG TPA: hypothetical protein VJY35_10915 [Candidatus Eisenbacteria bacterium]|nr:hypothetical protein [Candidatus Eisenbacteria bacterium]
MVVSCCGLALAAGGSIRGAGAGTIPLTVTEYNAVPRVQEPVTIGVPIEPSQAGSSWALYDGGQQIPLQATVLPHRTTPWLLLDFQLTLGSQQSRSLMLREQLPAAYPANTVWVVEDANRITVSTGPLRTEVNKVLFNLFDRVWLDRNNDQAFGGSELIVPLTSSANLRVRDAGTGAICSGRGRPSRMVWEYRGPMRATLRVDGTYLQGSTPLIDYTTRITWYAGHSDVKIEHLIRNSLAARERYVKLASAKLYVGSGTATVRIPRSGAIVWTSAAAADVALEMIPATFTVSTAYDPDASPPVSRVNATLDTGVNGGLVMGDLSHHGATWQVEFAALSGAENGRRATAAQDPLVALSAPERYAALDAFGVHEGSTYQDEKDAYHRWGWVWPVAGNPWSQEHNRPRVQDLYPSWSVLDGSMDPESDDLWQNIVMFSRVQIPFYLDRLRAWGRYAKWEWAYRTDGFDYAGAWGKYGDGPGATVRQPPLQPQLTAMDQAYIRNDIKRGKPGSSHMWNGGLLDLYYLTGDRDALEAALDVAEQCERYLSWRTPYNGGGVAGNCRFQGRCLLVLTRAWEATGDPRWRAAADHAAELFTSSPNWDPRGFFYAQIRSMPPAVASRFSINAKLVTPFMMTTVVEGLHRYWLATQNGAVRDQLLRIGAFARDYAADPANGNTGDEMVVDHPQAGAITHLSESQWRNAGTIIPYSAATSSESFINALIVRYRMTGERVSLGRARSLWERASKRNYNAPYNQPFAGPTEVGRFANSMQAWAPTSLMFPTAGDWTGTSLLFREAARAETVAPRPIMDLAPQSSTAPRPAGPSRTP